MRSWKLPASVVLLSGSILSANEAPIVRELPNPAGEGAVTPFLGASESGLYLSWLEPMGPSGKGHVLRVARFEGDGFGEPSSVRVSEHFFVNWADFPSVMPLGGEGLVAHWLEKAGEGVYEYDVWIALSNDRGASFAEPVKLHRDETLSEHGFASFVPWGEAGFAAVWLDGRQLASDGGEGAMAVAFTTFEGGKLGEEHLIDRRVCECCQTGMARTEDGLLAVYRDRSPEEFRDIAYARFAGGTWTEPRILHRDGWQIHGCPVNGPQATSSGDRVAVAWFTAAGDDPRVQVVFSEDGGRSFSEPVRIDAETPVGRVDVVLLEEEALVSWTEHVEGGTGEVRVRRVTPGGLVGEPVPVARTGSGRASGFPRMATHRGSVFLSWTESYERDGASRVRLAKITAP